MLRTIALLLTLGLSQAVSGQTPIARPVFKIGDSWTFARTDKLNTSDAAKFVIDVESVASERYTTVRKPLEGRMDASGGTFTAEMNPLALNGIEYDPPIPLFSFPLRPGHEWSGSYRFRNQANRIVNGWRTSRVDGWEKVKTPAGEFDAVRISFKWRATPAEGPGGTSGEGLIWYAHEVRAVVRQTSKAYGANAHDQVVELVAYRLAE